MIGHLAPERRPRWAAFFIAAGLAGLAALLIWDASGLKQDGGYAGVGPADVPRLIALGLLVLSGLTVVAGLRGELPQPVRQQPAPLFWLLGGMGMQLVLLHPAGFCIAGAALFGMTARAFGRKPLALTVAVGLLLSLGIYAVFDGLLELNLPAGPLERLIFKG